MPVGPDQVIPLSPNRFTPLTRTPWAGTAIGQLFKKDLLPGVAGQAIGESWEFSCDPSFPSYLWETQESLIDFLQKHKEAILSKELRDRGENCEILLKLLNAASPLSVQVHPHDSDPNLKAGECGKPESWLVVHAEPNSGLYIGFGKAMSKEQLAASLRAGNTEQKDLLQFIPVKVGEYFEIDPGVPHAIGPGVTLLEPQRVLMGLSGKTYRLWDWGRKYDKEGQLDPNGQARDLHIDEALNLVDPTTQVGYSFAAGRKRAAVTTALGPLSWKAFPPNQYYQVHYLESQVPMPTISLAMARGYGVIFITAGHFNFKGAGGQVITAQKGQPLLVPFASLPLTVTGLGSMALVTPASSEVSLQLKD